MTFDHDFGYSFPLFPSLLKKREEEKYNELVKIRDHKSCLSARTLKSNIVENFEGLFLLVQTTKDKHLKIKFHDGNQVDDKIAWGLGKVFLSINSRFVC